MTRSKVAIVRTAPETVFEDYRRVMNLAGYQRTVAKDADTALKVNISWLLSLEIENSAMFACAPSNQTPNNFRPLFFTASAVHLPQH